MSDGGKVRIANKKQGERIVRQLTKQQQAARIDTDLGVKGAGELIASLQKEMAKLKKTIAGQEKRIQLLVAFHLKKGDDILTGGDES